MFQNPQCRPICQHPALRTQPPSQQHGESPVTQPVTETPTTKNLLKKLSWSGEIDPQKWMNFYTKVLSKHVSDKNLKLKVSFETEPEAGISKERMEETKHALRELGLDPEEVKGD